MGKIACHYANSHSEDSQVGKAMTGYYDEARGIIRRHVNASQDDQVIFKGSGMTGAINWFQEMLRIKTSEVKPVVFITHMEHHSNQISWLECGAEVVIIPPKEDGSPNLEYLSDMCKQFQNTGRVLYGSFTACSNVTGRVTEYHSMARILHEHGGFCFVDFAASAPYVDINMHPEDSAEKLDAIFFSPHKFFGGPGSSGVVVFDRQLYTAKTPVSIGGGIVSYTDPWGGRQYFENIEEREDAGTPPLQQAIKVGFSILKKEDMGVATIHHRKKELLEKALSELSAIEGIEILDFDNKERQGIISFTTSGIHYSLVATVLSDFYGIQCRAGCSCAGTYGHTLFHIDERTSKEITSLIEQGDNSRKPGWVRISLHPTMTDEELNHVVGALRSIMSDVATLKKFYTYNPEKNTWSFNEASRIPRVDSLYEVYESSRP